jgi:hypothetical protein
MKLEIYLWRHILIIYDKMKKFIFIFVMTSTLLCNTGVKSQIRDLDEWTQKKMVKTADWLYDRFRDFGDFDRECFLIGTLDDKYGHYQTFTANKSIKDINDKVKWLFGKDLKFLPDTMRRQRITAYGNDGRTYGNDDILVLFVTTLFKTDYADLRALRVCAICPFVRHYGSEIKNTVDPDRDRVCNSSTGFDIELLSSSLAKTVAGYYHFDYDNVSAVSSGGDIGHRGVINKEKIVTDAQKMSFLAGVLWRYKWSTCSECDYMYSIHIPNSLSTVKECFDILKEFDCDIKETSTERIAFNASSKIRDLIFLVRELSEKALDVWIV